MQKKAITRNKWNSQTATLFKNSNILRLSYINRLLVGCFIYKLLMVICQNRIFNNYFVINPSTQGHLTRQHNDMHQLPCFSNVRALSITNIWCKYMELDTGYHSNITKYSFM